MTRAAIGVAMRWPKYFQPMGSLDWSTNKLLHPTISLVFVFINSIGVACLGHGIAHHVIPSDFCHQRFLSSVLEFLNEELQKCIGHPYRIVPGV